MTDSDGSGLGQQCRVARLEHRPARIRSRRCREGHAPDKRFEQDHAQRKQVGANVGALLVQFRRGVRGSGNKRDHARGRRGIQRLDQTEVRNAQASVVANEDILGPQIAVQNAHRDRRVQCMGDAQRNPVRLPLRQATLPVKSRAEGLALNEFRGDVGDATLIALLEQPRDIRMVKLARRARFLAQPRQNLGILRDALVDDLQGDGGRRAGVKGAVGDAQRAAPEDIGEFVVTDRGRHASLAGWFVCRGSDSS